MNRVLLTASEEGFDSSARNLGRWVNQVLGPSFAKFSPAKGFCPAINLYEEAEAYSLVMDLAGVASEDIQIEMTDSTMVITGSRAMPLLSTPQGKLSVHLLEIDHGRFHRSLEFPVPVNPDNLDASYRSGFLLVRIPKAK